MLAGAGLIGVVVAQPPAQPRLATLTAFSSQQPGSNVSTAWAPLTFRNIERQTVYTLVDDAGATVLRADAHASASGLTHAVDAEADGTLRLVWRWRTTALLPGSDLSIAASDDSPLRVQVSFKLDASRLTLAERARIAVARTFYGIDLPHSMLVYVWDRTAPAGTIIANPTTDRARALVVESGSEHVGRWRTYRRNVLADYRLAFGAEPPRISAISVMTDTDNTGATVRAFYGDVRFERIDAAH